MSLQQTKLHTKSKYKTTWKKEKKKIQKMSLLNDEITVFSEISSSPQLSKSHIHRLYPTTVTSRRHDDGIQQMPFMNANAHGAFISMLFLYCQFHSSFYFILHPCPCVICIYITLHICIRGFSWLYCPSMHSPYIKKKCSTTSTWKEGQE